MFAEKLAMTIRMWLRSSPRHIIMALRSARGYRSALKVIRGFDPEWAEAVAPLCENSIGRDAVRQTVIEFSMNRGFGWNFIPPWGALSRFLRALKGMGPACTLSFHEPHRAA